MPIYMEYDGIKGNVTAEGQAATAGATDPEFKYVTVRRVSATDEGDDRATTQADLAASATTVLNGGDEAYRTQFGNNNAPEAAPPGTGMTLSASLLGQRTPADSGVKSDLVAEVDAAALNHGTTVLAWARVDGSSPLAGEDHRGTAEIDSFSWNSAAGSETTTSATDWRTYRVSVDTIESRAGDDVVVDGRIITAENTSAEDGGMFVATGDGSSAALADAEWKYVTVRPSAEQDDTPELLRGTFDDLADVAGGGSQADHYYTGSVTVSSDDF
jgi:hypothetical protein